MDKNEYKKRLEELAVIKERKPAKSAQHNRFAKEIITEIDEETGEEYEIEVEIKDNPTLGFDLVKIKDRIALCELGCGEVVSNQIVEKRYCEFPVKHWRTKCKNCDCFVSPDGRGFIKGGAQIQNAYNRFFKGIKEPETQQEIIPYHNDQIPIEEITTNTGVIRRYK